MGAAGSAAVATPHHWPLYWHQSTLAITITMDSDLRRDLLIQDAILNEQRGVGPNISDARSALLTDQWTNELMQKELAMHQLQDQLHERNCQLRDFETQIAAYRAREKLAASAQGKLKAELQVSQTELKDRNNLITDLRRELSEARRKNEQREQEMERKLQEMLDAERARKLADDRDRASQDRGLADREADQLAAQRARQITVMRRAMKRMQNRELNAAVRVFASNVARAKTEAEARRLARLKDSNADALDEARKERGQQLMMQAVKRMKHAELNAAIRSMTVAFAASKTEQTEQTEQPELSEEQRHNIDQCIERQEMFLEALDRLLEEESSLGAAYTSDEMSRRPSLPPRRTPSPSKQKKAASLEQPAWKKF